MVTERFKQFLAGVIRTVQTEFDTVLAYCRVSVSMEEIRNGIAYELYGRAYSGADDVLALLAVTCVSSHNKAVYPALSPGKHYPKIMR